MRTLAYRSGDKNLINLFETGQDVYIYTAKSMLGADKWNSFDKAEKKKWRKIFKVNKTAVWSSNIPDYQWAKTVKGEIPNTVLTLGIAKGLRVM